MKKYLFLMLLLACPYFLYADTIAANAPKVCEYPKSKIARIEKKASKPTCNFSPRVSDKKNKDKEDKVVKVANAQAVKAPVVNSAKVAKGAQVAKPQEIKKAEPAKAAKPAKEAVAKSKAKEVRPKTEQPACSKKIKAQEEALKKIEKKNTQKIPKPAPVPKPAPKLVPKPASKKAAPLISVKPLRSVQGAELQKIEKARAAKSAKEVKPKAEQLPSPKKIKAQEEALKKIEKKNTQKISKPAPAPELANAVKVFKYRAVNRDMKDFGNPVKMNRIESSIVVPAATDNEELKLMFFDLLEKELVMNKKLDALWVVAYIEGEYPIGLPKAYGIWSPPGGWYDWNNTSDKFQYKWEYRFLRGGSTPR